MLRLSMWAYRLTSSSRRREAARTAAVSVTLWYVLTPARPVRRKYFREVRGHPVPNKVVKLFNFTQLQNQPEFLLTQGAIHCCSTFNFLIFASFNHKVNYHLFIKMTDFFLIIND